MTELLVSIVKLLKQKQNVTVEPTELSYEAVLYMREELDEGLLPESFCLDTLPKEITVYLYHCEHLMKEYLVYQIIDSESNVCLVEGILVDEELVYCEVRNG